MVTAGDKMAPPKKSQCNNYRLDWPYVSHFAHKLCKGHFVSLAVDMGREQNVVPFFDLSVWMDVADWDEAEQHFQMGGKSNFQIL